MDKASRIKIPKKYPEMVKGRQPNIRERMAKFQTTNLVNAIRQHPRLGRGTESIVDQCFTDQEILDELDREGITSEAKAIEYFGVWEGLDYEKVNEEVEEDDSSDDYFDTPGWWDNWEDHTKKPEY